MHATFPDVVASFAQDEPDKLVYTFLFPTRPPLNITAGQIHRDACRLAVCLSEQGIKSGELLPIAFDFGYPLVAAFLAAIYTGAIPAILPYLSPEDQSPASLASIQNLVHFSHAQAVLTSSEFQAYLAEGLAGENCRAIALPALTGSPSGAGVEWSPACGPQDIAYIQFSSGTTGAPKGAMVSHAALLQYLDVSEKLIAIKPDDIVVDWLPVYHNMGLLWLVLQPLFSRMHSVLMKPADWMRQPHLLFTLVDQYRGTISYLPNFAYRFCARQIRDEDIAGIDLSSWRVLGNGSEPVRIEDMRAFAERFAPYGLRSSALMVAYGMAEHVAGATLTPYNQFPVSEWVSEHALEQSKATPAEPNTNGSCSIVSCGYPRPGVTLRIVDEKDQEVGEREVGEVTLRSPCLFSGYYLLPEETAQVMRQGWLYTGDLGYLAGGQLYVCGRKKDTIIISGRNILPTQIEFIAESVLEKQGRSAAFGVPNAALGTEAAVVVCEMAQLPGEEDRTRLQKKITRQVQEAFQVYLADVYLVETGWIVKTSGGKIKRAANRAKYLEERKQPDGTLPVVDAPGSPSELTATEQQLIGIWERLFRKAPIHADDNFFALGGDSLLAVQLGLEIEAHFHCSVSSSTLITSPTPTSLAHYIDHIEQIISLNTLVPIQPLSKQSPRPIFFCVHGIGGGVLDLTNLARALGSEQPFYGLQARGLVDSNHIDTSIDEMASHYAQSIQSLQPHGPYYLGGYSFGALVAYETGRQLAEAGEKVELVAILDEQAPGSVNQFNNRAGEWGFLFHFLRNISQSVQGYLQLGAAQKRARRLRWWGTFKKLLLRLPGKKVEIEYQDLDENLASRPVVYQKITESNWAAMKHYSPRLSHNRLVVFCTPSTLQKYHDPYLGWQKYTTAPVESQTIAGAHMTILDEQNVSTLAAQLKSYLTFIKRQ